MSTEPTEWTRREVEVIGIGAATLDDLWLVPAFSPQETVCQAVAHVTMGGGPVASALCVLSRLGHPSALLDVCGDDAAGTAIRASLQEHGVDTGWMQTVPGALSSRAVVLVRQADGARQIHYLPSTAGQPTVCPAFLQAVRRARLLHVNGRHETAAYAAAKVASEAGVPLSFDGGAGRFRESIRSLVEASHLRIVSLDFAHRMTGQEAPLAALNALLSPPARLAVVTDGLRGSYIAEPGSAPIHQPALPASPIVDTTGCGDVYHGAFLHGWLVGWSARECAAFAAQLAARNAEGLGGRHVCAGLGCPLTTTAHPSAPSPPSLG
jgi:sugar/nucleoside kinase (ribokinase family)